MRTQLLQTCLSSEELRNNLEMRQGKRGSLRHHLVYCVLASPGYDVSPDTFPRVPETDVHGAWEFVCLVRVASSQGLREVLARCVGDRTFAEYEATVGVEVRAAGHERPERPLEKLPRCRMEVVPVPAFDGGGGRRGKEEGEELETVATEVVAKGVEEVNMNEEVGKEVGKVRCTMR